MNRNERAILDVERGRSEPKERKADFAPVDKRKNLPSFYFFETLERDLKRQEKMMKGLD